MADLNLIKPQKVQGIINKFCFTIGMLPTSYKMSMTYEEQILCIGEYLETTVYPAINQNAEAVRELQELFAALQNFITNYFDNLDIQEEIDNKIDEMANNGELYNIMLPYLQQNSIFGFDTVSDLKNSTLLTNGSFARTLGYTNRNDGGAAIYKIRTLTNEDLINESTVLAITNDETLVAELIIFETMPIECFGVTGLNYDQDSTKTNIAIATNVKTLVFNNSYSLKQLRLKSNLTMKGKGTITSNNNFGGNTDNYLAIEKENITIEDLTFNFNASGKLYFKECQNVYIKNCKINSFSGGWNIKIQYCNDCFISDNTIITDGKAYDDGIHVAGENIFITNNYVQNGSDVTQAGGDDSIAIGVEQAEQDLTKTIKNIVVSNNILMTPSRAINIYSFSQPMSNIKIDNNKCYGRFRISCETTQTQYLFNDIVISNSYFENKMSTSTYCCMINCTNGITFNSCTFDNKYNNTVEIQKYTNKLLFDTCIFYTNDYGTSSPDAKAIFWSDADTTKLSLTVMNCEINAATKVMVNGAKNIIFKDNIIYDSLVAKVLVSVYNTMVVTNLIFTNNYVVNPTTNQTQTLMSIATAAEAATVLIANNTHNFGNDPYWIGSPATKITQNDKPFTLTIA